MHIVLLSVFAIQLVFSGFDQRWSAFHHGIDNTEADTAQETCLSQAFVVSTSSWASSSLARATQAHFPGAPSSPFEGRDLFEPHCSYNDGPHSVALPWMQTTQEALSESLSCLPAAMAGGFGSDICPPARWTEISRDVYQWMELQSGLGEPTELGRPRSFSEPLPHTKEGSQTEGREDATEHGPRGKGDTYDAIPSSPQFWEGSASSAASDALAGLSRDGTNGTAHDDAAPHAADDCAHASSGTSTATTGTDDSAGCAALLSAGPTTGIDEFGTDGIHRNGQSQAIRTPCRYEASNAKDGQKRGSQGHQGLAQRCQTTWHRTSRSRGGHSSPHQSDRVLEKFSFRSGQDVARLHGPVSDARERTSGKDSGSSGKLCASKEPSCGVPARCGQADHRDQGRGRRPGRGTGVSEPLRGQDQRRVGHIVCVLTADEGTGRRHCCGGECGEEAAYFPTWGASYGGGRTGRFQFFVQAAFCLARLSMTFSYDSLGPCRHWSVDTPGPIIKWHNRAVLKEEFVSEWKARDLALGLASELSGPTAASSSSWTTPWSSCHGGRSSILELESPSRRTRTKALHVGFAEPVDVWIGCEDSFQMYHTFGSLESFSTRTSPWSRPNLEDEESSHRTFDLIATSDSSSGIFVRGLNPRPVWAQDIFELLQQEGQPEADDDEPVVYVTSYFIDHAVHPHHSQPRLLRFDMDVLEWERDVCLIWEDYIDVTIPFDVTIVRPASPHQIFPDAAATAIVHQRANFDRAVALITTVHIMDPTTRFSECAHSFPRQVDTAEVLQAAQVAELCQERRSSGFGDCTLHSGHLLLPDGHQHQLHHGIGLHLRIPPALSEAEQEQNFERRVRQRQLQHPPHAWNPAPEADSPETQRPRPADQHAGPEDATSFMASSLTIQDAVVSSSSGRSSRSRTSSSSSSRSISISSEAEDWRQTVIFSLDGRSISTQLPWHDQTELYRLAAREFDIESLDIIRLHLVLHRPLDYVQVDLHGLLLQRTTEGRPTPFERLVLLDLELHVDNDVQPTPFRRHVRWVPYATDRASFFHFLGLARVLAEHGDICYMWRNNIVVPQRDTSPMNFLDGDYVKIFVGDADMQELCISESDAAIEDNATVSNASDDASSFFQRSVTQFQQAIHGLGQQLQVVELKTDPHPPDPVGVPLEQPSRVPAPRRTNFNRGFHPDDQRRLARLFEREAFVECEEEGRVAYIETWNIHQQHRLHCRESRPMKLYDNPHQWAEEILALWEIIEEQENDIIIHVVQPSPQCTRFQCVLAHVIIEQAPQPNMNVGIISIEASDHRGTSIEHEAHSLPDMMGRNMVLRKAELEVFCQTRICSVRLGAFPFGLVDIEEIPRAVCLTIHIRPLIFQTDESDHMELMQRPHSRWRKPSAPQAGQDLSSSPARCEGTAFVFNPEAPAFDPVAPAIGSMPERVQDLYHAWQQTAFSWEGESASTMIITWFVDQHNMALHHCRAPRVVRLYDDFAQWEAHLRQAWWDVALPGAPITIHVVEPHPANVDYAHVLVIQNPLDQFSTSLITGYDHTMNHPGPVFQLAMTTPEILHYDQLLLALGLGGRCLFPGSPARCSVHFGNYEIFQGIPFPARDGHGLKVRIMQRPTFQDMRQQAAAPVLLQLSALIHHKRGSERQTTASVAHEQWPLPSEIDPDDPDLNDSTLTAVKIKWMLSPQPHPDFVTLSSASNRAAEEEMSQWGLHVLPVLCPERNTLVCLQPRDVTSDVFDYVLVNLNKDDDVDIIVHSTDRIMEQQELMGLLYQFGFWRAVIESQEVLDFSVYKINFIDQQVATMQRPRHIIRESTWPEAQYSSDRHEPFFQKPHEASTSCMIDLGITTQDLMHFFESHQQCLRSDFDGLDIPQVLRDAINACDTDLQDHQLDRLLIYADGSSLGSAKHLAPLRAEEEGTGDTWAYVILGERYGPPGLRFIGWTAHPVIYEAHHKAHLGASRVGADVAEREALSWSALWRLSQNWKIPTCFRSDSRTTLGQASGDIGTAQPDETFKILRGSFQALEAALGPHGMQYSHVPGHSGEVWNEMCDWLAKAEREKSFYCPRPSISMRDWSQVIDSLWLVLDPRDDLPKFCGRGLHAPPPRLPDPQNVGVNAQHDETNVGVTWEAFTLSISACTANVGSLSAPNEGCSGKIDFLRRQFIDFHFNFLGVQESKSPEFCSCVDKVLRLSSGCHKHQQGVELWINLAQPYGYINKKPIFLERQEIQVVHKDPRILLARVETPIWQCWLLVAYAPQSGLPLDQRERWWAELSEVVHRREAGEQLIAMIDANAAPGGRDDVAVFAEGLPDSVNTPLFRGFVTEQDLFLPCTTAGAPRRHCHPGQTPQECIIIALIMFCCRDILLMLAISQRSSQTLTWAHLIGIMNPRLSIWFGHAVSRSDHGDDSRAWALTPIALRSKWYNRFSRVTTPSHGTLILKSRSMTSTNMWYQGCVRPAHCRKPNRRSPTSRRRSGCFAMTN